MNDIAARAGTSASVVSLVLNGAKSKTVRTSDETRERILRAAEELGYRRNPLAGALATGRSHVLGMMFPHASAYHAENAPFESLVMSGVMAQAARQGYNVMMYSATAEDEGDRAARMIDRRIDGLILVVPPSQTPIYAECERQGIAVVSILARPEDAPLTVNSDEVAGARLATRHLLELGHRRIGHLLGKPETITSEPRLRGYADALTEAGIQFDPEICREGGFSREVSYTSALELMRLPISLRPTAIFAANDPSAHGAIDAIHEVGLRVPDDVSVVGYDDTWYATITRPPLTTVRMRVEELGRRAADLLIARLTGAEIPDSHPVLPVSLTIRESARPLR
ncbi:LacI family DNA-binding transcriptional regulator [soil metagenome]